MHRREDSSTDSRKLSKLTKFSSFAFTDTAITKDDMAPILKEEQTQRKHRPKVKLKYF